MQLTRAAFAVLIKFQGLTETLNDLVVEADQAEIPAETGEDRKEALLTLIFDCVFGELLLTCWLNATKMRRWLVQKKQQISAKYDKSKNKEDREKSDLCEII